MLKTISLLLVCLISLPVLATEASNEQSVAPVPAQQASTNYEKALKDTEELKKKLQETQTNNEQLQRDNTTLKQENNALKQNLQTQLDVMAGNLKALEERTANTPTNESLEILATSFYERLRSTDDSVSFWGIVSGLIASLITIILASLALFHFGKIRVIENKAASVLAQSQRETRMAINEAIRTSRKQAIDITHKWIQDEGAVAISNHINKLNQQLESVEKSVTTLRKNERIAEETTNNIMAKERTIKNSTKNPSNNRTNNSKKLITDTDQLYALAKETYLNIPLEEAMRVINQLINHHGFNTAFKLGVVSIKLLILVDQEKYHKAVRFYEKNVHARLSSAGITSEGHSLIISALCRAHLNLKNFSVVNQIAESWYDYVIQEKISGSRLYMILPFAYTAKENLGMSIEPLLEYVDNSLSTVQLDIFEKNTLSDFKLLLESKIFGFNPKNINQFIDSAKDSEVLLDRSIHATHICLITETHQNVIDIHKKVKTSLTKSQKNEFHLSYSTLLLNLATALYRSQRYHSALRLAYYVQYKIDTYTNYTLDYDGYNEINEILDKCPKLIAKRKTISSYGNT